MGGRTHPAPVFSVLVYGSNYKSGPPNLGGIYERVYVMSDLLILLNFLSHLFLNQLICESSSTSECYCSS